MIVDIIIPHFGPQELLDRCLASIEANTRLPHRVTVIDNNRVNLGFSVACNQGIQQTDGEYVVLLNNDTEVPAGWLESMVRVAESEDKIAAVGPLSTAPTQWQWVHAVSTALKRNLPALVGTTDDDYITDFPRTLAFWCTLFPRWAFEEIGLLDEQFFMYAEDDDWCLRASKADYKLALDLSTVVTHRHRANRTPGIDRIHKESIERLKAKWADDLQIQPDVLIGVLNQGEIRTELAVRLLQINRQYPGFGRVDITFSEHKPTDNNRNMLVRRMLDEGYDYLVMCDSDTVFQRNPLELIAYDPDVAGLATPIYNVKRNAAHPIYWNVGDYNGENWNPLILTGDEGLVEVGAVGTGCIIVARRVFEHPDMQAPFMRAWSEDGIVVRGSDFEFCQRARAAGFKIYVDTRYVADHLKVTSLLRQWSQSNDPYRFSLNGDGQQLLIEESKEVIDNA